MVDDSERLRRLIAKVIADEGHIVANACDGHEAWRACLVASYDIVIADLRMPNMGGDELIGRLRASGYSARSCIMSASFAAPDMSADQMARMFGADAALAKPFEIAQLRSVLRFLAVGADAVGNLHESPLVGEAASSRHPSAA